MRILFLTGEFPPLQGGVGDCTNEIARALAQRGVEVSVLTSDPSSVISNQSSVSNLQSPVSNLHIFRTIQKWNWSALAQIRKTISEIRPDIVHIQYQTGAFGMQPMINFFAALSLPLSFQERGSGGEVRRHVSRFAARVSLSQSGTAARLGDVSTRAQRGRGDCDE